MATANFSGKFIEKFYCECGKECKPIKMAKTSASATSGMVWVCQDGHVARKWFRKERINK